MQCPVRLLIDTSVSSQLCALTLFGVPSTPEVLNFSMNMWVTFHPRRMAKEVYFQGRKWQSFLLFDFWPSLLDEEAAELFSGRFKVVVFSSSLKC